MKKQTTIPSLLILVLVILLGSNSNIAQNVGISDASFTPNANAMLEVKSLNKGFLPPRVELTGTNNSTPLSAHVVGMLVYNTATAGNVTPGLYVNDGSKWVALGGTSGGSGGFDVSCSTPSSGNHSIVLYDAYGDGWQGGSVDLLVNDVPILTGLTISAGYPNGFGPVAFSFTAETGDVISTVYYEGLWPEENYYLIRDVNNTTIADDGGSGVPVGLTGINANSEFTMLNNTNYTIRGLGSGLWECSDKMQIDANGNVSINTNPSSSFRLRVLGNVGIGSNPSSGYSLSVGGSAHITNYVGIGTTPSSLYRLRVHGRTYISTGGLHIGSSTSPPTNGIYVYGNSHLNGNVGIGTSPSSSYDLQVSGQAYVSNGLRVGTTSSPASNGIIAAGEIRSNNSFNLNSSTTGTGTNVIRTSGGLLRPQSSTIKVKDNIKPLQVNKEMLLALRPVSYNLKPALGGDMEFGLIAEEVQYLVPELVIYGPARKWKGDTGLAETDEDGNEILDHSQIEPYSIRYDRLPVMLLEIIKEHEKKINELQQEINLLKNK